MAVQLLHQHYQQSLLRIAFNLTREHAAAQDIVQDTFFLVWQQRHQLSQHHDKSIEHFLVRVVRNKAITYFKRKKLQSIQDLRFLQIPTDNTQPDTLIIAMRNHITTFTPRQQQCILLKIDHNLSLDEIATQLGVSRKMVEKAQTAALKRLRQWARTYQPD